MCKYHKYLGNSRDRRPFSFWRSAPTIDEGVLEYESLLREIENMPYEHEMRIDAWDT